MIIFVQNQGWLSKPYPYNYYKKVTMKLKLIAKFVLG